MITKLTQEFPVADSLRRSALLYALGDFHNYSEPDARALFLLFDLTNNPWHKHQLLNWLWYCLSNVRLSQAEQALSTLQKLLEDDYPAVREEALKCLIQIYLADYQGWKPTLMTLISKPNPDPRTLNTVAEIAGLLQFPEFLPLLSHWAHSHDETLREQAVRSLALINGPQVLPTLLQALFDPEKTVREHALWGMDVFWLTYRELAIPWLIDLLNSVENPQKAYLRKVISNSGDPRAAVILSDARAGESSPLDACSVSAGERL